MDVFQELDDGARVVNSRGFLSLAKMAVLAHEIARLAGNQLARGRARGCQERQ